jgi:CheY-like chemotaxis protein
VPALLGESPARRCWNCDAIALDGIRVTLRSSAGRTSLLLCRPCYSADFLPTSSSVGALVRENGRGRTVLVVDDDPDIVELVSLVLADGGYAVETAANGQEALRKVRDRLPSAIVLDLRMPVMDGPTFLRTWRTTSPAASVPVLAMSAHEDRPSVNHLDVQAFIRKPFDLGALIGTLDALTVRASSTGNFGVA